MRPILYIISLLILVPAMLHAQEKKFNRRDEQGRKQGVWKKYHAPDTLRYKGQFKDDRPVGTFRYYYRNGNLQSVLSYEKGTKDTVARAKIYFPTGELMARGKYVNRQRDENWLYFDYDSNLVSKEKYIRGKRYGKWEVYFDDGGIAEVKNFDNDLEQGAWRQYYQNGQLKIKATYVDGALEGMAEYYDTDGDLAAKGSYKHGVKHGIWKYYNEKGELEMTEEFANGKKVGGDPDSVITDKDYEEFYRNDKLDLREMLKNKSPNNE